MAPKKNNNRVYKAKPKAPRGQDIYQPYEGNNIKRLNSIIRLRGIPKNGATRKADLIAVLEADDLERWDVEVPSNDDFTNDELVDRLARKFKRCMAESSKKGKGKAKAKEAELSDTDIRLFNQIAWRLGAKSEIMRNTKERGRRTESGELEMDEWEVENEAMEDEDEDDDE